MTRFVLVLGLAAMLSGCAGAYGGYGYPGFGVAPDDQVGMVQANSACDYGRGANDKGSTCFVTRRTFDYVRGRYE